MKPYPTYLEFTCPEHPEIGWVLSDPYFDHVRWFHGRSASGLNRERPVSRDTERHTQYIGWPVDMHQQLEAARRADPYR